MLISNACVVRLIVLLVGTFHFLPAPLRGQELPPENQSRTVRELRLDTASVIRKSKADDQFLFSAALVDLCKLHRELVAHPQFETSTVLIGCRARIASRLGDLERKLKVRVGKAGNSAPATQPLSQKQASSSPNSSTCSNESGPLADYVADRHLRIGGALSGGIAGEFLAAAGAFAPGDDYSQDLMNLIQVTVHPDQWRRNGGEAVMEYWQPGLSLIVHADQLTHQRLEALLTGLRGR